MLSKVDVNPHVSSICKAKRILYSVHDGMNTHPRSSSTKQT